MEDQKPRRERKQERRGKHRWLVSGLTWAASPQPGPPPPPRLPPAAEETAPFRKGARKASPCSSEVDGSCLACREWSTFGEDGSSEGNHWGNKEKLLWLSWRLQTLNGTVGGRYSRCSINAG